MHEYDFVIIEPCVVIPGCEASRRRRRLSSRWCGGQLGAHVVAVYVACLFY